METLIVKSYSVENAIESAGVEFCSHKLLQVMAGDYYYIECKRIPKDCPVSDGWLHRTEVYESYDDEDGYPLDKPMKYEVYFEYKVYPVSLRLAWFIIDCLKLKSQAVNLGSNTYSEEKLAIYLSPGVKFMGKKIKKLTKIPAEIRPIVVEEL